MRWRFTAVTLTGLIAVGGLMAGPVAGQPGNDDFADAISVMALPFSDSVDVVAATVESGEPVDHCAEGVANTVWYALTLDRDAEVAVDTRRSDFDTVAAVFTGSALDKLEEIACMDDLFFFSRPQARVVFTAVAGTTYWIQVGATVPLAEGGKLEISFRGAPHGRVVCDAEVIEDFETFYLVAGGDTVTCVASGLNPQEDVEWLVDFFDLALDGSDAVASHGEVGVHPDGDGTLTFEFVVPDIVEGVLLGLVSQGAVGEESYLEEVAGLISTFVEHPMTCDPDPVVQGDVECVVEGLQPGEFEWQVFFLTAGQALTVFGDEHEVDPEALVELFLIHELFLDPDIQDFDAEADENGVGVFTFGVPTEGEIDAYLAVALQGEIAAYLGEVRPVDIATDGAVPIPRPTRVETGGGGAPSGSRPGVLLLAVALVVGAAVTVRHFVTTGR